MVSEYIAVKLKNKIVKKQWSVYTIFGQKVRGRSRAKSEGNN
jgi:hypothetical protein